MLVEKSQAKTSTASLQIPAGTIMPWAGGSASYGQSPAPKGWLYCDGSAVSRETYSALFAAIGTSYGPGNGSTTFNLPGFEQAFVRSSSGGQGSQNNNSTYASNHSHNSWTTSVSINHGNNGNDAGSHNHNGVGCETNSHAFGHNFGAAISNNDGMAGRTVGNANYGRSVHGHSANYGMAGTHNGSAHNVAANTANAGHSHTGPSISNASTGNSTASGAWSPLYIDMWHLIKA